MVYACPLLDNSSFFKRYFLFYLWRNSTSLEIEVPGVKYQLSISLTGWSARISIYSSITFSMPTWLFQPCACVIHVVRTKAGTLLRSGQVCLHLSQILWLFPLEPQLDRAWLRDIEEEPGKPKPSRGLATHASSPGWILVQQKVRCAN